jgi:hypothetical protein
LQFGLIPEFGHEEASLAYFKALSAAKARHSLFAMPGHPAFLLWCKKAAHA